MAANNLTPLEAIRQLIEEELVRLRYSDYVMLNALQKRGAYQNNIRWNVNVTQDIDPGGRATTANANVADTDEVKNANLAIGQAAFTKTISLLKTDIQQARFAGVGALRDLVGEQLNNKMVQILRGLNKSLYTGTGAIADAGVVGLDQVTDPAVSYAGIDVTLYPQWAAPLLDNGGADRPLTVSLMNQAEVEIFRNGKGTFEAIFTTPEIVQKYTQEFANNRNLLAEGNNNGADLGFTGVTYKGRPIIQDRDCPAGCMYWADTMGVELRHRDYQAQDDMEVFTTAGMTFTLKSLPAQNMYTTDFEFGVQPQLKVHDRRQILKITDIDETP